MSETPFPFTLACPQCQTLLIPAGGGDVCCPADGARYHWQDGIGHFLIPARAAALAPFMHDYQFIRQAEGRGAARNHTPADRQAAAYYRALPEVPADDPWAADWRIRAISFQTLLAQVIAPLEANHPEPLSILDLGAGCGWLSNRLAQRQHRLAAIDLMDNDFDGLGVWPEYDTAFWPLQAEFEHLPLAPAQFDLAIFNASLHYAVDIQAALASALLRLKLGAALVILDTPLYRHPESGRQMVQERMAHFRARFGIASDALASENFLTYARLDELARALDLHWQVIRPRYGLAWELRSWRARLRQRRPPAEFVILMAIKRAGP
jgi:SAM-dependent methyltransferase